jgi:hypothetical protein
MLALLFSDIVIYAIPNNSEKKPYKNEDFGLGKTVLREET